MPPLTEGDRLLDLEQDRHAAVVGAVAVLDRHEVEEPDQLRGAAGLLRLGEGGGGEALECPRDVAAGGGEGGPLPAAGGALEQGEGGVGLPARRGAAGGLVLRRQDLPEAGGERRRLRPARPEAAPAASSASPRWSARRAW